MAEYIEREAVEKFIEDGLNNPDVTKRFGHDAIEIMAEIHYMPAADVEEVVRCKDCYQSEEIGDVLYCTYWRKNTDENGYCHEGG